MADFLDDEEQEQRMEEELDEMDEQQRLEEQAQRRRDKNRLKKILTTAPYRFYPHLTPSEERFVKRMKKKGFNNEVRAIESAIYFRKQALHMKTSAATATAIPFIGFLAIVVFIIIVVIVILAYLFPFLFPEDETGGSKGAASPFGIKGDKFYGARAVYKDETLSRNGLIEQYVDIVQTSVENLQAETYTEIVKVEGEDDKTYDVKLTINLTLPAEDFNYENLDLTQFQTNYATLYNIVGDIAKLVYKVDNDTDDAPADLTETLDGIKYFGFNAEMIGSSIDDDKEVDNNIIEIVYDAFTESGVIILQEKLNGSSDDFENSTNVTIDDVDDNIRSELISIINIDKNKVRAEKLFIKDFILEDANSYMEGIEKKNYVALIYMPKEDVNFSYVSYMITIDKTADFSMILTNNGSEISLSKGDGENLGEEDNPVELTYTFTSSKNMNQTANITDIIDTANLNKFTSGSSLFKVISEASDYNTYLEETTTEYGENVLTYKTGSMIILFETDVEFIFNDEIAY